MPYMQMKGAAGMAFYILFVTKNGFGASVAKAGMRTPAFDAGQH